MGQLLGGLKDRHTGQRCVLVCNGPSLNRMDLSFLKKEILIGLNKIYLGFRKYNFYPKYYVSVNRKVLEQSAEEIAKLNCVKFIAHRGKDLFTEGPLLHFIRTGRNKSREFSDDISDLLDEGNTVTYVALQLAFYLGFSEVVIIGMDHNFVFSGKPNQASYVEGEDLNHFTPSYFSGQTWDNPDLQRSEYFYAVARKFYEDHGRRILDATVDGKCDVFKKVDYKKVFFDEHC